MSKNNSWQVRNLSDIQQEIAFIEHDFYQRYAETFKTSELGRIKSLLPLREMAISFGLVEEKPKSIGRKYSFGKFNINIKFVSLMGRKHPVTINTVVLWQLKR